MIKGVRNLILRAQGYEKVKLRDTKGILKPEQSYKWVRQSGFLNSRSTTILPSGTKVINEFHTFSPDIKIVKKPNGDEFKTVLSSLETTVSKNGEPIYNSRYPQIVENAVEKLQAKKQQILDSLRIEKVVTKDGKNVTMKFNKDNKLVYWERNGAGENVETHIRRYGKSVYSSEKFINDNKIVVTEMLRVPGQKSASITQSTMENKPNGVKLSQLEKAYTDGQLTHFHTEETCL